MVTAVARGGGDAVPGFTGSLATLPRPLRTGPFFHARLSVRVGLALGARRLPPPSGTFCLVSFSSGPHAASYVYSRVWGVGLRCPPPSRVCFAPYRHLSAALRRPPSVPGAGSGAVLTWTVCRPSAGPNLHGGAVHRLFAVSRLADRRLTLNCDWSRPPNSSWATPFLPVR